MLDKVVLINRVKSGIYNFTGQENEVIKFIETVELNNVEQYNMIRGALISKYGVDIGPLIDTVNNKVPEVKKTMQDNIIKAIPIFSNYRQLAKMFLEIQPMYYDKSKIWWCWNHQEYKWEMVDETDLLNLISKSSEANTINQKSKNEILEVLKQESRLSKPIEAKPTWIQFKNQIVDIKTGESFEASSKYFVTNPIPWELGFSEETPVLDKIFSEWVDPRYVPTLYEIIAYCLLMSYPIERIFCFIGSGSNGKSCYLSLLRKFIGEGNITSTDLNILVKSRFEVARLYKKLACQMGETDFNELNNTQLVKKLVSGKDIIGFELKNKNPFDGVNYAKLLIATNNLPTTTDKTVGFYRRWTIIDFPNTFSEKRDILSDIPDSEYNNLARKSICVLKELLSRRMFTMDGEIEDRMKRYEEHSDPIEKFMNEMVEENFDSFIFKYQFKEELDEWCLANRFRKLTDKAIAQKMKEKQIGSNKMMADWFSSESNEKPRYHAWVGIKWKDLKTNFKKKEKNKDAESSVQGVQDGNPIFT